MTLWSGVESGTHRLRENPCPIRIGGAGAGAGARARAGAGAGAKAGEGEEEGEGEGEGEGKGKGEGENKVLYYRNVSHIVSHPEFNPRNLGNTIALLFMAEPFQVRLLII